MVARRAAAVRRITDSVLNLRVAASLSRSTMPCGLKSGAATSRSASQSHSFVKKPPLPLMRARPVKPTVKRQASDSKMPRMHSDGVSRSVLTKVAAIMMVTVTIRSALADDQLYRITVTKRPLQAYRISSGDYMTCEGDRLTEKEISGGRRLYRTSAHRRGLKR